MKINGYELDDYRATGLAEGFEQSDDEEEIRAAWQYLHTTGLGYRLQGSFGRSLRDLIEAGQVDPDYDPANEVVRFKTAHLKEDT